MRQRQEGVIGMIPTLLRAAFDWEDGGCLVILSALGNIEYGDHDEVRIAFAAPVKRYL